MAPLKRVRRDDDDGIVAVESATSTLRQDMVCYLLFTVTTLCRLLTCPSNARRYGYLPLEPRNLDLHASNPHPPARVMMIPMKRCQTPLPTRAINLLRPNMNYFEMEISNTLKIPTWTINARLKSSFPDVRQLETTMLRTMRSSKKSNA